MKKASKFTKEEVDQLENEIDYMTQMDMARLWSFAKPGNPIFRSDLPFFKRFEERFKVLGGFTPEISKALWMEQKLRKNNTLVNLIGLSEARKNAMDNEKDDKEEDIYTEKDGVPVGVTDSGGESCEPESGLNSPC